MHNNSITRIQQKAQIRTEGRQKKGGNRGADVGGSSRRTRLQSGIFQRRETEKRMKRIKWHLLC